MQDLGREPANALRVFDALLDTNVVSDLVRHPQGRIADHVRNVGETKVCTSVVVAAELRYGAAKKRSQRGRLRPPRYQSPP